jgi:hypothetical protein
MSNRSDFMGKIDGILDEISPMSPVVKLRVLTQIEEAVDEWLDRLERIAEAYDMDGWE